MASHSNRSPSPLSSRPINSNMRNSENNSSIRRSFSGSNPFAKPSVITSQRRFDPTTPANSPSDFTGRRSVGKEGAASHLGDCEEKENDKKDNVLKALKMQSPAKGCKNFMAPTISAASKFTPSPRKKALVERNDAVRTSISLSDGKAMFFSAAAANVGEDLEEKTETSLELNQADDKKAALDIHPVPKPFKKVPFSDNHSTESVITDSDDLMPESCSMSKKAVLDVHPVSRPCKKVTFSDIHSYAQQSTDSDSLRAESSSMDKGVSSSIAPLDADPSLPPYDPKTNYLSPRPQFIRYKPNRRVGMLLNKENGLDSDELMMLDDSLMAEIMSGGSSDSADEGTDESQTDDSKKEEEIEVAADESQTEDLNKEEEIEVAAAAAPDMVIGVDEEIEADSHVSEACSESLPVSTTPVSEEEIVQINEKKKPRALSRLVCFSMILMFLIAGVSISVTRSPSFDESFIKDFSLYDLSNLYRQSRVAVASARSSVERLALHVNDVSASSVSLIFKLANELVKGEKKAPMQFMNLSDLQENPWSNEGHFPPIVASLERVEEELDDEMDYAFEEEEFVDGELGEDVLDTGIDTYDEESYAEAESDDYIETEHDTQDDVVATAELESEELQIPTELISNEDHQSAASQHKETELEAEVEVAMEKKLETEKHQETEIEAAMERLETEKHQETEVEAAMERLETEKHQETQLKAEVEVAMERLETEKHHQETELEAEVEVAMEKLETEKLEADTISTDQTSFSKLMPEMESTPAGESSLMARHAVAISSIFAGLLAVAAAFIYHYKKRTPSSSNAVQVEPMLSKQTDYECTNTSTKPIHQEKEFSRNWQQEEVVDAISVRGGDDGDESCCPSEMSSSFQRSGSYSRRRAAADEVQSSERKARKISKRESLASSTEFSMGSQSYSYGSFTTYEKISIKSNAKVEEEIMTPVRRSSRIRKQVIST